MFPALLCYYSSELSFVTACVLSMCWLFVLLWCCSSFVISAFECLCLYCAVILISCAEFHFMCLPCVCALLRGVVMFLCLYTLLRFML